MPVKTGRWWLTQDGHQIVINATPEHIYNLVADLPRMGEWSPECKRVDWADGSTMPVEGAKFVGHNRGGPFNLFRWSRRGRVLAADPGREFAFITEGGPASPPCGATASSPSKAAPGSPSPTK